MTGKEVFKELKTGKEVVVIATEKDYDSAIFWKVKDVLCSFSRHMGVLKRPLVKEEFINHIDTMISENAFIFVRGRKHNEM